MIVSASRRTDIPAFYSEWLMNRIRAGFCLVANPFNPSQISRVDLTPDAVDAIVFWSKNPAPLLPCLDLLDSMGYRYYFQYTICGYPTEIEPHLPPLSERINTAAELAHLIGERRVIWRYDPVVISNHTDVDFHREQFSHIADALERFTVRVVVSLVDFYDKVERNLGALESRGWEFTRTKGEDGETRGLLRWMQQEARLHGIEMQSCAESVDLSDLGIPHGKCVDDRLLYEIWGIAADGRKDRGQRDECRCAPSKDIGANDTCLHGCRYCYATASRGAALSRHGLHDPKSPILIPIPGPSPK